METSEVSFTAKDVMTLRQRTDLPMMECKKALTETGGDLAKAEEWLRERLKGKMASRTERATAEGRVAIAIEGAKAALVEILTETDFTARNENFGAMAKDVAQEALKLPAGEIKPNDAITKRIDDLRISTGENVNFGRGEKLEGGHFGSYVHHDNKRGALIQVDQPVDEQLLTDIGMHIVAHVPPPIGIDQNDVPADKIEEVRKEAIEEAKATGKNAEISAKIAEGRVRKYLEETTLLNQKFVKDPTGKMSVKDVLPKDVTVKRFLRYTLGG